MLDYNGNTAVYLLYAYARIHSIFRKIGKSTSESVDYSKFNITCKEERDLVRKIAQFTELMTRIQKDLHLHLLCEYAYELCTVFTSFYSVCKVQGDKCEYSRLIMCNMTQKILKQIFELLGIEAIERI